jgi:hypothetical protein
MRKIVKYALILAGIAIFLAGTSLCLTLIYRNEILKNVLTSIAKNNHINFEVKEVNFILSLNLKNTKFLFKDVEVKSKNEVVATCVFWAQAEYTAIEVNLLAFLLRRELQVEKISVSNGSLQLLPSATQATQGNADNIENLLRGIKLLSVENFTIYDMQDGGAASKIVLNKAALHLAAADNHVSVKARGDLLFTQVSAEGDPTQPITSIRLNASGTFAQGVLNINYGKVAVDGLRLTAKGEIGIQPFGQCSLNITAKGTSVENALFVVRQYAAMSELESASGKLDIEVNIGGSLSDKGRLWLNAQGNFSRGEIKLKNTNTISIRNLNYSLHGADLSNVKSYSGSITGISATYQGFELSGDVSVSNFGTPMYNVSGIFSGDVKTLNLTDVPEGKIVGSVNIKAREWSPQGIDVFDALIDIMHLNVTLQEERSVIDGEILVSKNHIVSKLTTRGNLVSGNFEGKIYNYLPYLLDSKKPYEMRITGELNANLLNLDKLLLMNSGEESMLSIRASINARTEEMLLFDENCKNSSAKVYFEKSNVIINELTTNMFGGLVKGDLKIHTPMQGDKKLNLDLYFNDVEIDRMNFLNKNFNIKKGSIQGSCNGILSLNSPIDEKGLNFEKAFGFVNFTIQNGQLYKFEPIQALSGYVRKKLLQDLKFAALRNTVIVENGTFIVPRMEIRSSALNTYVSGKQEVKGDFDYHLTLFVNELLLQKNRNIENPINDDKTKLFLRFTSKNGKREVKIDSQEWGNNFAKKMQREADDIRANSKGASVPKAKIAFEWEDEPLEEKQPETPKKEEKKKPATEQKSDIGIEWEP